MSQTVLRSCGVKPRPLELVDSQAVREVYYMPHGYISVPTLGDYVMVQPIVLGLRKRYPNAELTVVAGSKIPFSGLERVNVRKGLAEWEDLVKSSGKEGLFIGRISEGDAYDELAAKGGTAIHTQQQQLIVRSNKLDGGRGEFDYLTSKRLASNSKDPYDNDVANVHTLVRAFAADIGLITPRYPAITCPQEEDGRWRGWIDSRGKPGASTFFVTSQNSMWQDAFSQKQLGQLAAEMALDSNIVFNPGYNKKSSEKARGLYELASEDAPEGRLLLFDGFTTQADIAGMMNNTSIVFTPNTGDMHLASALNKPLVLAYFIDDVALKRWIPENPSCFGAVKDTNALFQGHAALTLLSQKRGLEVFKDGRKALQDAKAYTGMLKDLDPVTQMDAQIEPEVLVRAFSALVDNLKPEYKLFFQAFEHGMQSKWPPHWHTHTQHPLYRYSQRIVETTPEPIPVEKLAKLI